MHWGCPIARNGGQVTGKGGLAPLSVLLALCLAVLSGCAGQARQQEAHLAQLLQWLPGEYDNTEQAQADRRQAVQPHEELAVAIVPVYAPLIGRNVFYVQEMAANDPRRVLGQRLIAFEVVKGKGIVQSNWSLAEPGRWRDAHRNPDLFKALQYQDMQPMSGCELLWTQETGRFTGANDQRRCLAAARGGSGRVFLELRAELGPDELALSDRAYDAGGKLVYGRTDEPFYRYRRRAAP